MEQAFYISTFALLTSPQLHSQDLKFPVAKLATSADKVSCRPRRRKANILTPVPQVMILIQIILECIPGADVKTESCNPHTEAGALWQQITRMTRCKCSDLSLR